MKSIFIILLTVIGKLWEQSLPGDVVGKSVVSYQGWFIVTGDNSPINRWFHWTRNSSIPPATNNCKFEIYPDTREYEKLYPTQLANFGNGQQAKLFSSWDDSTIDLHWKWMQQYSIETIALQRFPSSVKTDARWRQQLNGIANKVRLSSKKYGRKFYINYDVSDWAKYTTELIEDLDTNLLATLGIFNSPAYARQNGKVIIGIWGIGFKNRPDNKTGALNVINELKRRGVYVIGGVPRQWRTEDGDSLPNYLDVYRSFNMIQPWVVGGYNGVAGARGYQTRLKPDFDYLNNRTIDYQPVIFPGSAWSNWNTGPRNEIPRLHGDFMWQQYVNLREIGIKNCMIAMFDEYDEGTAIAKAAEDSSMIPTDQYFLTLDADGVHVSSDFYLRLQDAGTRMMKGQTALRQTHDVPFTNAPSAPNVGQIVIAGNPGDTGNTGNNNNGTGTTPNNASSLLSLLSSFIQNLLKLLF